MTEEVLIKCEHVSKKFCKDLKRSLWYGLKDVGLSLKGNVEHHNRLRKDEFWAVHDVSFELRRGECLGLIGHNGAGKSTLLKMLNGLINPDQGTITMRGRVGALIELGAGFNPILTGRENIYNNGAVLGFTKPEIDSKLDAIVDFSEIGEFIDTPVQNFSSGMKVRLGFAVAAQMDPDILLIDEVLAVGDLGFIIKCLNRMGEMMPNTASIFVTHSMPMMARICSKVMLMHHGKDKVYTHDTAEAILRYTEIFESPKRINQGTGEIDLEGVSIFCPERIKFINDDSVTLKTSDDLRILINLNINENISRFDLFITMFDGQLREALASSSEITQDSYNNLGNNKRSFEIFIPSIMLATGRYSITIGASDPVTKKFFCRFTNSIYFTMKAIANTWATSIVPGEWKELKPANV